jgi:CheY-like chemotaxis protein
VELCKNERFDLIIMDVRMPFMDGLEALRIIRAGEAGSGFRSHVIALTGYAGREEVEACLDAGADDYLTKPVEEHLLFAKVDAVRTRY